MTVTTRLLAPVVSTFCAVALLAVSGSACAVPLPVEQADRSAAGTTPTPAAQPYQATAQPPMVGTPSGGTALASAVPIVEPGTLALFGLGLVIVGFTTSARSRARRGSSGKKN